MIVFEIKMYNENVRIDIDIIFFFSSFMHKYLPGSQSWRTTCSTLGFRVRSIPSRRWTPSGREGRRSWSYSVCLFLILIKIVYSSCISVTSCILRWASASSHRIILAHNIPKQKTKTVLYKCNYFNYYHGQWTISSAYIDAFILAIAIKYDEMKISSGINAEDLYNVI